jgi:eukaryotic-like serine/threonine-protein kinase
VMPAPELTLASVRPVLADVPCSALVARVDGGSLTVQGYLPADYGSARLRELLMATPGLKSLSAKNLHEVTQDKCAVIEALGPYWTRNAEAQAAASIRMKNGKTELAEGDTLIVDIRSPKFSSFVYVDYFGLDGGVAHLLPNIRARDNEAPPSYEASIGSLGGWVISKPFGAELIVMLATPESIFAGLRPEHEARSDYLAALGSRLKTISDKFGPDRVAVDFVQITTSARKR